MILHRTGAEIHLVGGQRQSCRSPDRAQRHACREIIDAPVCHANWVAGLEDGVALILEAARPNARLADALDAFASGLRAAPTTAGEIAACVADLAQKTDAIVVRAQEQSGEKEDGAPSLTARDLGGSASRGGHRMHRRDLDTLVPWMLLATARNGEEAPLLLDTSPDTWHVASTLRDLLANARERTSFLESADDSHAPLMKCAGAIDSSFRRAIDRTQVNGFG